MRAPPHKRPPYDLETSRLKGPGRLAFSHLELIIMIDLAKYLMDNCEYKSADASLLRSGIKQIFIDPISHFQQNDCKV